MKLLVSNDDGVFAPGIKALSDALKTLGDVETIAPDRNCSGASNSLSLENPIRVQRIENGYLAVKGTPTDCVHLAVNGLLDELPDLVVTGINAGANLGDDVLYSGTVAGATEGRLLGIPAIAVSLAGTELRHYETAAKVALKVARAVLASQLPSRDILNVNVPDLPYDELKGYRVTRLGHRHRAEPMLKDVDPRGLPIYWLGLPGAKADAGAGTDFDAIENGYVSITPISVDMTAHGSITGLADWLNKLEN
jgi:5'-nucleotidase